MLTTVEFPVQVFVVPRTVPSKMGMRAEIEKKGLEDAAIKVRLRRLALFYDVIYDKLSDQYFSLRYAPRCLVSVEPSLSNRDCWAKALLRARQRSNRTSSKSTSAKLSGKTMSFGDVTDGMCSSSSGTQSGV